MTEAYRNLLRAAKLVMCLHDMRNTVEVNALVPGYRTNLDPQAEKQLRVAIIWADAEVEMPQEVK
jgi:hypothetical protein